MAPQGSTIEAVAHDVTLTELLEEAHGDMA
jgi:hypothetical protein